MEPLDPIPMEPLDPIPTDNVLRDLENRCRGAIVKVFCPERGPLGWTGFVVNQHPCVIITVAHPFRKMGAKHLHNADAVHVTFFEDPVKYPAIGIKCSFKSDLAVFICWRKAGQAPPPFLTFANPQTPLKSSTSIFSIAHPGGRDFRTLLGNMASAPFPIGQNSQYHPTMTIFDHTVPLFPGASGGPIINLAGCLIGMQLTEHTQKARGICICDPVKKPKTSERNKDPVNEDPVDKDKDSVKLQKSIENNKETILKKDWEVKELTTFLSSLRQAVTVQFMAQTFSEMFMEEGVDFSTSNLNDSLKKSIELYLAKYSSRGRQLDRTIDPNQPPKAPPSGKKPKKESVFESTMDGNRTLANESATRMQIAVGDAKGLPSLKENSNSKILYRQVQTANILHDFISEAKARNCTNNITTVEIVPDFINACGQGMPTNQGHSFKIERRGKEYLAQPPPAEKRGITWNSQVDALLTKGAKGKNVAKGFGQALSPSQSLGEQQRAKWSNGNENIFRIPPESCIIRNLGRIEIHIEAIPSLLEDECLKREYLNGSADGLVFSNLKTLDLIALSCRERSLRLDGSASISERQKLVNSFNDKSKDELALLICKAGGCGLSSIGGNRLVLFDPDWNSANDKQTAARVWRGGQKKVYIYRFLSTGTIEQMVYQCQMSKEGLRKDIQKEQADLKKQGNFLSTEDLRDLFFLHENVSLTIERRGKESVAQPPPAEKRCVSWNSKMDALLTKGATGKNVAEAFGQAMAPWQSRQAT